MDSDAEDDEGGGGGDGDGDGSGSEYNDDDDDEEEEDWDAEEESSAEGSLDSDESEGKDWEELEREAIRGFFRLDFFPPLHQVECFSCSLSLCLQRTESASMTTRCERRSGIGRPVHDLRKSRSIIIDGVEEIGVCPSPCIASIPSLCTVYVRDRGAEDLCRLFACL